MKKRRKWIIVLTLCAGLCVGCGNSNNAKPVIGTTTSIEVKSEEQKDTTESETAGKTMEELYEEIKEKVEQPEMVVLNDNYITNYYGIDLSLLEDYLFVNAEDVIYADTIVLLKVKEEASAQIMTDALNAMMDQKKLELENYLPEQYQIVENSEVVVSGQYVYLIISEKAEEIQDVIEPYLK